MRSCHFIGLHRVSRSQSVCSSDTAATGIADALSPTTSLPVSRCHGLQRAAPRLLLDPRGQVRQRGSGLLLAVLLIASLSIGARA